MQTFACLSKHFITQRGGRETAYKYNMPGLLNGVGTHFGFLKQWRYNQVQKLVFNWYELHISS